jgi:hypothetical protein
LICWAQSMINITAHVFHLNGRDVMCPRLEKVELLRRSRQLTVLDLQATNRIFLVTTEAGGKEE